MCLSYTGHNLKTCDQLYRFYPTTIRYWPHIVSCIRVSVDESWSRHYTVYAVLCVGHWRLTYNYSRVVPHCNTSYHEHSVRTQAVLASLVWSRFCSLVIKNQTYVSWYDIFSLMCAVVHITTECAAARSRTFLPPRFLLLSLPAPGLILTFNMHHFVYPKLMWRWTRRSSHWMCNIKMHLNHR